MDINQIEEKQREIECIIQQQRIATQITNFRLPGFKLPIFNGYFINNKSIIRLAKKRYHSNKDPTSLIKAIQFDTFQLQSKIQLGTKLNTVTIIIPHGIPIRSCEDIVDASCNCSNPKPCVCIGILLLHCIDKSPTTSDLINSNPIEFEENNKMIKIGELKFDKNKLPIQSNMRCNQLLNSTYEALTKYLNCNAIIFILLAFLSIIPIYLPICNVDNCNTKYKWDDKKCRGVHYCRIAKKSFTWNPIKNSSFFKNWTIDMIKIFLKFIISLGLDLPFTKQTHTVGVKDDHTLGKYFGYMATVCEIVMEKYAKPLEGPVGGDGMYDGKRQLSFE